MKKIHLLLVLFLSLIFLLACEEKEEIIPSPKLEITVTPGVSIPVGSSVTFIFKVENLKTLKVNGEQIPFNSSTFSLPVQNIEANTTFVFRGIGENGDEVEKSITINTYTVSKPIVDISASSTDIYYKDKVAISISFNAPFTVNGHTSPASFVVQPEKDTTFIVEATNAGGISKDTVIVKVKPYSILLCKPLYWTEFDLRTKLPDGSWSDNYDLTACDTTDRYMFCPKEYVSDGDVVNRQSIQVFRYCDNESGRRIEYTYWDLLEENNNTYIKYYLGAKDKIISLTHDILYVESQAGDVRVKYKAHY